VGFALAASALFTLILSSLGNFGYLARQRVQLLPFYFVLLCTPPGRRTRRKR
jgi:hypothetical protein